MMHCANHYNSRSPFIFQSYNKDLKLFLPFSTLGKPRRREIAILLKKVVDKLLSKYKEWI